MKFNCKLRNRAGAASPGSASRGERVLIFDKLLEIEEASDKVTLLKYIYSTKTAHSATILQNDWIGISLAVLERLR